MDGSEIPRRYCLATQRPSDALALGRDRLPELIVSCEGGAAAQTVARRLGCELDAREDRLAGRSRWSSSDVGSELPTTLHGRSLLTYATSRRLESEARRVGARLRSPDASVKHRWDRKTCVRRRFAALGLSTIPSMACSREELIYLDLSRSLGAPFVLQQDAGSAGSGTWLIDSPEALASSVASARSSDRWLASSVLEGPVINVHGLVCEDRVAVGIPTVQLTGVPSLTALPFGYCGSDSATDRLPGAQREAAVNAVVRIGEAMRDDGWRGLFGVDLILTDDDVLPLEVNPRLQGSSWLVAEVEARMGRQPIGAQHRELMLGGTTAAEDLHRDGGRAPEGGFVAFHGEVSQLSGPPPKSGAYVLDGGALMPRGPAAGLLECEQDEVYVEGFAPGPGLTVARGATVARLATWERVVDAEGRLPSPMALVLIRALRELIYPNARDTIAFG